MVKEFTNPLKEPIDDDINLFDFLDRRAQRDPDGSAVEYKADGGWKSFSATQFRDLVIALGKGLIGLGVKKGDAVSIVSRTRWEWTALDMAIMAVGALTVPVYETNSDAQVSWIFNDSQATIAFAEDDGQRDKIESIHDEVQSLRKVFVIEAGALEALQAYGKEVSDEEFWARKNDAHGDDLATIVYTSGSTGTPQGRGAVAPQSGVPVPVGHAVHAPRLRVARPPSAAVPAAEPRVRAVHGAAELLRHADVGTEFRHEDDRQGFRVVRPDAAAGGASRVREGV